MFHLIACNFATMMIAMLYCRWRDSAQTEQRNRKVLHERVSYMLWAAANRSA